jgi:hypothetical protein
VRFADSEVFRKNVLMVRKFNETNLWAVERLGIVRPQRHIDEVLVFNFGPTPILTRSCASAMQLAMHCRCNPPSGLSLRWIKVVPDDLTSAVEFAWKHQIDEALSPTGDN